MNGSAIADFFVQLGFDVDPSGMDTFVSELAKATAWTTKLAGALVAAAAGVALFAAKTADALDELGDFADREQIGVEALQELGYAAQLNGSSLDAVKSSVQGVNTVLGQAAQGIGRAAAIFQKLGFSATDAQGNVKSFDQFIGEVSDRMQGLSRQEQVSLAEKLGFDRSLVPLLVKGRSEIVKLREEARKFGVTTQEQIDIASKFQDRIDKLKFRFENIKNSLAVAVLPWLEKFMDKMEELWPIIKKVAEVLLYLGAAWAGMKLAEGAIQLVSVLSKLGPILSLILNPLTLIVGLVALLIQDFVTWQQGGESLIGSFLSSFPELTAAFGELWDAINRLADVFMKYLWPIIEMVFRGWGELFKLILPPLISLIALLVDGLAAAITFVVEKVAALIDGIASVVEWIGEAAEAVGEFVNEPASQEATQSAIAASSYSPMGGMPGALLQSAPPSNVTNGATTTSQVTTNTVNIPGGITVVSPDPARAGVAVGEELDRRQKSAVRNEQTAVML